MSEKPLYLETHQFGPETPTEWENALGDALEAAFADGIHELGPLVARLNEKGVRAPDGSDWTPETFEAEIKRLGE